MRSAIVSRRGRSIGLALALLALASCGGGGGSSAPPTPPSKLFFVDAGNHAIVSSVNAAPTLGSTFPINRIVEGSNTGLGLPGGTPSTSTLPSIALDAANDRLYVSTQLNVVVFNGISTADGNVGFSRRFQAAGVNFLGLSLDTLNNLLYTVDPQGVVRIFTGASGLNNTVVPARTLTPDFGSATIVTTFGIAVDNTANNLLYIGMALNGATSIFVYSNASGVNSPTPVAPDQNLHFAFGLT